MSKTKVATKSKKTATKKTTKKAAAAKTKEVVTAVATKEQTPPVAAPKEVPAQITLTAEHEAQLQPWGEKWIKNAMSCEQMTEEEKTTCRSAVDLLYEYSDLKKPEATVFVDSVFILRVSGGLAGAIWFNREEDPDCGWKEPDFKGKKVKGTAVFQSIVKATCAATNITPPEFDTPEVLSEVDYSDWWVADTDAMHDAVDLFELEQFGLDCIRAAYSMWQGGNLWSSYVAFLSFFREVVQIDIDWTKWMPWENLAKYSGPRLVHHKFCIISDRPEKYTLDSTYRSHCEDGPFVKWRDGTALYSVHSVQIPAYICEKPELITAEKITKEQNAEIKRVMIDKFGRDRYIQECGGVCVDEDERFGKLFKTNDPNFMFVEVVNSTAEPDGTFKKYYIRVDQKSYGGLTTARAAVASTFRETDGSMVFAKPADYNPQVES